MEYNWAELNRRCAEALRYTPKITAIKFIHTDEELEAIPDKKYPKLGAVCEVVGLAGYYDKTLVCLPEDISGNAYCQVTNGLAEIDEHWESGAALANVPFKWFETPEESRKHTGALVDGHPKGSPLKAIAVAPIKIGSIKEPDVISLVIQPGAAFYFLSGLVYGNYRKLNFPFVGESSCMDTWGYTYNTGLPGISLGCRGDRCSGAMNNDEMRLTVTPKDFVEAIDGMVKLYNGGITFPFYPGMTIPTLKALMK
ncbi:MAG: DUF169 domain-containing protein [Lachnospiraceae bacterium]|nr:DUF169 domain-containing protein [Lachnospiraceae bacterium]